MKYIHSKLDEFARWLLVKTGGMEKLISELSDSIHRIYTVKSKEVIEEDLPIYAKRAEALVRGIDRLEMSGEYKRHQVYAKLIKEFPGVPKRTLGLAIEVAVAKL